MKKFFLVSAAIILFSLTKAIAGGGPFYGVPSGPNQALATADYGGVDKSTVSFSSANVLCFAGVGSVVGFILSSGTAVTDFVLFRDTDSLISGAVSGGNPGAGADDYRTTSEFVRIYTSTTSTVVNSSVAITGSDKLGTTYTFPKPIRVYRGLTAKLNVATYGMLTVLWNKLDR